LIRLPSPPVQGVVPELIGITAHGIRRDVGESVVGRDTETREERAMDAVNAGRAVMEAWDGARIELLVPDVGLHRAGEQHWLRRKYEKPQRVCSRPRCRNSQEHHQGKSAAMSLRVRAAFLCFKTDARIDSHGRGEGGWRRARRSRI
jgi:hypothetical protein